MDQKCHFFNSVYFLYFHTKCTIVEWILNCRLMIEKHLQHQRDLFHNFIDFKKAFDRVWHNGLWSILRGYNIEKVLSKLFRLSTSTGAALSTSITRSATSSEQPLAYDKAVSSLPYYSTSS